MNIDQYVQLEPFSLESNEKSKLFSNFIRELTNYHYNNNIYYKNLLDNINYDFENDNLNSIPFVPTRLFKNFNLMSIKESEVFKILQSSGTSQNGRSKIFLDKNNAKLLTKILSKIVSFFIGDERMPLLIIDSNPMFDRSQFDAKIAAYNGFSIFAKNVTYILNEKKEIDYRVLKNFLEKYSGKKFLIFGFTSNVYEQLFLNLKEKNFSRKDFAGSVLIHGGGWKKMENISVNNQKFRSNLKNKFKFKNILNYYGLIEQTGSIFFECEKCNSFVTSIYSDILIRDENWKIIEDGKKGYVQLFSLLPRSYPGHSILTEDIGQIINNDCACKKFGKRFLIHGRKKTSELRGCSDV